MIERGAGRWTDRDSCGEVSLLIGVFYLQRARERIARCALTLARAGSFGAG